MNAYELADKLQMDKAKALLYVDTVVQSAEMLRQQADRIAELEKDLHMIERHYDQLHPQTKPLSDEEIKIHQTNICVQLGREIKTLRTWMGFNQEDLAKSLNISRSALVRCEQGKVPFNKKIYDAAKKFLVLNQPSPFFNKPLRSDKL